MAHPRKPIGKTVPDGNRMKDGYCWWCGVKLRRSSRTRLDGTRVYSEGTGAGGDGLFCRYTCGYQYAVRAVRQNSFVLLYGNLAKNPVFL
jgi:hypothetical protein